MTEHTVHEADSGIRLDRWFKRHFPQATHGTIEKALRKGDIRVGGKKAKAADRVEEGMVISARLTANPHAEAREAASRTAAPARNQVSDGDAEALIQSVLYRDNDVIVINKPSGLAVQGGSKITKSVDGMLDLLKFDGKERPKLVHRLDRDTSGVLVLARSARVATRLMHAFAGKKTEKTYWALINGVPDQLQGKIDAPLAKQEEGDHEKVGIDEEDGKRAVTYYRVIDRLAKKLAWVELIPVTGRTHQLRVHMASIGHPIVGDGKYGGREAFVQGMDFAHRLHLHVRRIVIPGMIDVTAPLSPHMEESFASLGLEPGEDEA